MAKEPTEAQLEQESSDNDIHKKLTGLGLMGKVWPVYKGDMSPAIYAMVVPETVAAHNLDITKGVLTGVMKRKSVWGYKDNVVAKKMAEYGRSRKAAPDA